MSNSAPARRAEGRIRPRRQAGRDTGSPLPGMAGSRQGPRIAQPDHQDRVDDRLDLGLADPSGLEDRLGEGPELALGLEPG